MNNEKVLHVGVRLAPSGKYEALYSGKYIGTFDTKDEAAKAHHKFKQQKEQEKLSKRTREMPIGVKQIPSGKYQAIYARKYLGVFDTPEEAEEAYKTAKNAKIQKKLEIQSGTL